MFASVSSPRKAVEEALASISQGRGDWRRLTLVVGGGRREVERLRSEGRVYCAISEGASAGIDYLPGYRIQ